MNLLDCSKTRFDPLNFNVQVVLIHLCRKGAGIQHPGVISPDTERLLRNAAIALKEKIHSTPQTKVIKSLPYPLKYGASFVLLLTN